MEDTLIDGVLSVNDAIELSELGVDLAFKREIVFSQRTDEIESEEEEAIAGTEEEIPDNRVFLETNTILGSVSSVTKNSRPISLNRDENSTTDVMVIVKRKDVRDKTTNELFTPNTTTKITISTKVYKLRSILFDDPGTWIIRASTTDLT